jgi:hypothetical protein
VGVLQGSVYPAQLIAGSDLTGATVSCTVTAPDLTVASYSTTAGTVTIAGTLATANVPAALVGTYLLVWAVSGTQTGTQQDQFSCDAPTADLISLSDLREELNLNSTVKDEKLRRWLRAANGVIENITGPIRPYPQTDYFDGGTESVVLMARWVSSITSVKENWAGTDYALTEQPVGASTSGYGYTFDRDTNTLVRRLTGGAPTMFYPGVRNVAVSYIGGLSTIPEDIQLATAELIRHWYAKSQPVRSGPFGAAQGDEMSMGLNYMVPNAVQELLAEWRRPPGIF